MYFLLSLYDYVPIEATEMTKVVTDCEFSQPRRFLHFTAQIFYGMSNIILHKPLPHKNLPTKNLEKEWNTTRRS